MTFFVDAQFLPKYYFTLRHRDNQYLFKSIHVLLRSTNVLIYKSDAL